MYVTAGQMGRRTHEAALDEGGVSSLHVRSLPLLQAITTWQRGDDRLLSVCWVLDSGKALDLMPAARVCTCLLCRSKGAAPGNKGSGGPRLSEALPARREGPSGSPGVEFYHRRPLDC